jgi:hypothetical protein
MKIFVRFSSKSFFTKNIILHYNTTYWFDYQKNQLEELEIETTSAFWAFLGHCLGRFKQYLAILGFKVGTCQSINVNFSFVK